MTTSSLFLVLAGVERIKQELLVLRYAERHDLAVTAITADRDAAVHLVADGAVRVVLAAFCPSDEGDLPERVMAAGGRLEYVRSPVVQQQQLDAVVRAAYSRGTSIKAIAALLGMEELDVRRTLLGRHVCLRPEDRI